MASAYDIFARAERIELAAADLYRRVVDRFPWAPGDRDLLKGLEAEEIQHAARIRLLAAHYRHDSRLFGVTDGVVAQLECVEAKTRALAREIDLGMWDEEPEELQDRLAQHEVECGASHAEILAEVRDGGIARFFRELAEQDSVHRLVLGIVVPVRRRRTG